MNTQANRINQQFANTSPKYLIYPWLITLLSAVFLFYKYIMQVSPSVMTTQWMQAFHINATGLGNLAAIFFATYLITQIFVGVLLDRLSPRILSGSAILISAIGTLLFAESNTLTDAILSRALMGVGAAFATVSYMKLTATWFRPERFALIGGLLATAAMLGGVAAQGLTWLIDVYGWRYTLVIIGCFGVILSLSFITIVRDQPKAQISVHGKDVKFKITLHDLIKVISNSQNWLLTIYSGLAFAPVSVLGGLWGNPFISEAYHLSSKQTSTVMMVIFWGLAIGGPLLGMLSDSLRNRRTIMLLGALLSLITITLVLYVNTMPLSLVIVLLFLFGFGTGAFMLGFTIGKETNPIALTATVIALINTGDAIFGAITEPMVGKFLDMGWTGLMKHGVHYYTLSQYKWALSILPVYLAAACILAFFLKETPQ